MAVRPAAASGTLLSAGAQRLKIPHQRLDGNGAALPAPFCCARSVDRHRWWRNQELARAYCSTQAKIATAKLINDAMQAHMVAMISHTRGNLRAATASGAGDKTAAARELEVSAGLGLGNMGRVLDLAIITPASGSDGNLSLGLMLRARRRIHWRERSRADRHRLTHENQRWVSPRLVSRRAPEHEGARCPFTVALFHSVQTTSG